MSVDNDRMRAGAWMKATEKRMREAAAREAADWFIANGEGLDADQRRMFAEWLKRAPIHVEEYLAIAQLDRDLHKAVVDPKVSLAALLERARTEDDSKVRALEPRPQAPVVHRGRWLYAAAAAAMLAFIFLALPWWPATPVPPSRIEIPALRFTTPHGEQLTERLADGSVLHLNTDTSVAVRYGSAERRIDIARGQAVFEVAHDTARPLRVFAGSAEIVAVGTVFEVYLRSDSTLVTVVEGRVMVSPNAEALGTGARVRAVRRPMQVASGQRVRVVRGELPAEASQVDAQRATAWLRRQIVFEQEPLAVVAAEFNRYSAKPIEIETPALQGLAISGVFAADDTESFVAFLRSLDGVNVQVTPTRIRVWKN
jgi:transmembrane sensor